MTHLEDELFHFSTWTEGSVSCSQSDEVSVTTAMSVRGGFQGEKVRVLMIIKDLSSK